MDGKGAQCPVHDLRPAQTGRAAPARFDPQADCWILSSYADVQAAFHEPNLCPVDSHGDGPLDGETRASSAQTRMQALAALAAGRVAEWQAEFEPLAATIAMALPLGRAIDVLGEFARPWSLALAARVSGAAPEDVELLAALAARVTIATACPEDESLKPVGDAANDELNAALADGNQPMPGPAFVALSQTVPCLLANAWLILLRARMKSTECGRMDLLPPQPSKNCCGAPAWFDRCTGAPPLTCKSAIFLSSAGSAWS